MDDDTQGRILVVDDSLVNLQLLVDMLSGYGFEIFIAQTGEDAIRIFRETSIDLVLLDIMMPGLNGYEVCRILKSSPETGNTPVIFLSALDYVESKVKGFSVGGVDYVSKPFKEEEIIARIRTHLSLASTRRALEKTIRELTRSEELRKNTEQQLEIILNSISSVIYVADMQTYEVLYANNQCREIFGDIIGKTCFRVLQDGQSGPCPFCSNDKLISPDGISSGIYTWEFKNTRNSRWYLCLDVAIPWNDGRNVRMEIATDITEKKMIEVSLKRSNQKLNLLSNITRHDILNLLTAVFGYYEFLGEMELDPKANTLIGKQKEAMSRIEQMITFTRDYQDMGCFDPVWQQADTVLLNAICSLDIGGVRVENDLHGLTLYADPLLEKVFYNLIENALRHGISVSRISFSYEIRDSSVVIICDDDGIGISKENKYKIFSRQYFHNSGFGLYLSRDILDITGMTIGETGIEGSGARFEITVPQGNYVLS